MKIVGLITEYNPFHNGHLYHLKKAKELTKADYVISIMSGNFVQRGNPAFIDKWSRTKMALLAGVDLVVELPVIYATSSAEFFAYGAIQLLHQMGIVNSICFGSEEGHIEILHLMANILCKEPYEFKELLKKELSKGVGFAIARNRALYQYIHTHVSIDLAKERIQDILSSPNNILGIEYLKALQTVNSSMTPYTIKRYGAQYHSTSIQNDIASATAIRKSLIKKDLSAIHNVIPQEAYEVLQNTLAHGKGPITLDDFSLIMNYLLATLSPQQLKEYTGVSEGLENRILKASQNSYYISQMIQAIGTKRYTNTRIRRSLLHILLRISRQDFYDYHLSGGPQYIRILGFKKNSTALLSELKLQSNLPIISNIKSAYNEFSGLKKSMLEKEIFSTDIYALGYPNIKHRRSGYEFTEPMIIL